MGRYERPASANAASSFSFVGDAAASGAHSTPRLLSAQHAAQQHRDDYRPPDEAEGPIVVCHCNLACNKLEAKTERNMGLQMKGPQQVNGFLSKLCFLRPCPAHSQAVSWYCSQSVHQIGQTLFSLTLCGSASSPTLARLAFDPKEAGCNS